MRWVRRAVSTGAGLGLAAVLVCVAGAFGSAFYLFVMATKFESWCPLCLTSHVCSFLILGLMVLSCLADRTANTDDSDSTSVVDLPTSYPSLRLSLVVLLLVGAVCAAEWSAYRAAALVSIAEYAKALQNDGLFLEATYFGQVKHADNATARKRMLDAPKATLNVRDDDPMIMPDWKGYGHTLVVFSDIECPSCARFDRFLDEKIRPLYEGHLRLVFKHNPRSRLDPNAQKGAQALEAARIQGKFWKMRDLLSKNRRNLSSFDYRVAATQLGLDVDRFFRDMSSKAVRQRINEDKRTAAALKSTATPDVFLSGRRVDRKIRDLTAFWRARADQLKSLRLQEEQGWGQTVDIDLKKPLRTAAKSQNATRVP